MSRKRRTQPTQRTASFTFFSILMFVAGIAAIFAGVIVMGTKLKDGDASKAFVVAALVLTLAYGIFEIVVGIASLSDGRRITNQSGCVTLTKLVIILCVIQMGLSLFNGIMSWQLGALFVIGILIPIIYLFVSKRGRVKRPPARQTGYNRGYSR